MMEPTRLCTACRTRVCKSELIRIVKLDGTAQVDYKQTGQGRGAYICRNEKCISLAHKRHCIERSLGLDMQEDIYIQLKDTIHE